MDKRKRIKMYFEFKPTVGIILAAIGFLLFISSFSNEFNGGIFFFGLLMMAGGGFLIHKHFKDMPTDQQIDAYLKEDLEDLGKKALSKFAIEQSQLTRQAVFITGPKLWDVAGARIAFKRGKDSNLRFNPIEVCVINFGANQLLAYKCVFDFMTGNPLNESTDEYFYKDVVSVSTKTESKTVMFRNVQLQMNAAESFALTTSGGTSISVMLKDPTLIQRMGGGVISTTLAEEATLAIRTILREKKQ